METAIKPITNPKFSIKILSDRDIKDIHTATLDIIQNTGVRFPSERALQIWSAHGAEVDPDSQIVKAKPDLIESAIAKAPPRYILGARQPDLDMPLDGNHVFLGTDGCGVEVIDIHSGQRRMSQLSDVRDIARIADGTDDIAFNWVALSAQDKPVETRGLHEIKTVWENSSKHVQTESIYNAAEAEAAMRMALAVAGSEKNLREKPVLSLMQCSASPLGHDGGSLDAALIAGEFGVPAGFMTMASCLTTGPATMAGTLAVGNAEVIAATALLQLANPGAPVFYAAAQTASDPRTGVYTGGGPEDFLFGAATNQLADFYDIPLSMGSFATGAKTPNWQAGIDNSLSTLMACAAISDMLLGVGFLHGSRIWSYAQMQLDCEIFAIIRKMLQGIEVNQETLALDAITSVGPGGNFLGEKHTRAHMRDLFIPKFMDRRPYNEWEDKGDNPPDWALEKARSILSDHEPLPLEPAISKELTGIIDSLEKDL